MCCYKRGVFLYEVSASKGQGFHPGMFWFRLSFSHGRDPISRDVFTNNQIIKKDELYVAKMLNLHPVPESFCLH